MKNSRYYIIAVVLFVLPMLVSCRKDLCYNHFPAIGVTFTWEQEWERDYGAGHLVNWDADHFGFAYNALKPSTPEWISLVHYSEDQAPEESFLSPKGERLIMSGGKGHSMLFYNGDTEYIVFSDMASLPGATASATSRSRSSITSVAERHPDSRTTNQPDVLYAAFVEQLPEAHNHELKPLPVKMQPLVYTYIVRYEFEKGLEHVRLARGALGGMAEAVYLRDGVTSDRSAIVLYDCEMRPYGCEAHVRTFGVPGFPDEYYGRAGARAADRPYTLNLEVMLSNGKTVEFNFDISDQMANQPRGGVIEVSGVRIEEAQSVVESGFDVEVSGWGDRVDIELPMN